MRSLVTLDRDLTGYKKLVAYDSRGRVTEYLCTLRIPAGARVVLAEESAEFGEAKCRASQAKVVRIQRLEYGRHTKYKSRLKKGAPDVRHVLHEGIGDLPGPFSYAVGAVMYPHEFNPSLYQVCAGGIHFFRTKKRAIHY
jgi:hypothetical protein